ncbi:RNA helicase CrhR [Andreprevotia sp. IGB-42]|uniref:ligase-associated DNA damage response DEXH box helicase n=1 Tax=Andreprevotia sp. IGB-42 TaxID=2497473 RepID=UPI001356EAB9|nr:ligase-associated DNA damage response DEXH box helicase [Andreprevotia sp. IGB-42]KAF0813686.1 RNA helicase CrhR [Andreprevotia sp. IGB-42]
MNAAARFDPAAWLAARQMTPFPFQHEVWQAIAAGESGMLHATTGAGKTWAIWLGALAQLYREPDAPPRRGKLLAPPLTVLWLTPMRALASDTHKALLQPLEDAGLNWTLGIRTGDTPAGQRAAQQRRWPTALITTPESLTLLLARADAPEVFANVQMVVADEWHELIGNKRGVQVQLVLARLRQWNPALQTWGLSATLGNVAHAQDVLLAGPGRLVAGRLDKTLQVDTLLPANLERFPWAGHLGLKMLPQVVAEIDAASTSLVFLNTRSQTEIWYQAILAARPDWAGLIALHHGSLDREVRDWVEANLKNGQLKAAICTSSLDLGVDFHPVERVLQIGSPKGIARLLQRAGRSGHAPGRVSRITLVPTHSLELVESAAAQRAIAAYTVEGRTAPDKPLDVLVQHVVTVALGGGFVPAQLLAEVRSAPSYRTLTDAEWAWVLGFVRQGGEALTAYPEYHKVAPDEHGVWRVPDAQIARRHRMSIGTIVSDASMQVQYMGGKKLGTVEEGFIARLAPGDCFLFGGRLLELARVHDMTAYVRRATGNKPAVPRWNGGKMPLSTELADAMLAQFEAAARSEFAGPEMQCVAPLLQVQLAWSALPTRNSLLIETLHSREGTHLFIYPFAGRHAHLGLGSLIAWRLAQHQPMTFSIAVNDYGFELLTPTRFDPAPLLGAQLFGNHDLVHDVLASLNAGELAQRRFREIARIAGLVFQGFPGAPKSARQLQASSSLFYQVFRQHDPANLLLGQSEHEVLRQELDVARLDAALQRMATQRIQHVALARTSPFAFPLLVERFREKLSSEKLADRIARLLASLEKAAGGAAADPHDSVLFATQQPQPRRRSRVRKTGRPTRGPE